MLSSITLCSLEWLSAVIYQQTDMALFKCVVKDIKISHKTLKQKQIFNDQKVMGLRFLTTPHRQSCSDQRFCIFNNLWH
jgi:hypothetical protein